MQSGARSLAVQRLPFSVSILHQQVRSPLMYWVASINVEFRHHNGLAEEVVA